MKNKTKITDIAQLLPEGLSKEAVNQIAQLVQDKITEEVDVKLKTLNSKVYAFLRMQIDAIKKHALSELTEENETYRNAKMFENLKSLMAIEVNSNDETTAVTKAVRESSEVKEENEVLLGEFNKLVNRLEEQERVNTVLRKKLHKLTRANTELVNEAKELQAKAVVDPEELHGKAVMITEENTPSGSKRAHPGNEFLNPEIMALMPK